VDPRDHIVIVDADALVRPLLERWLREKGYGVIAKAADNLALDGAAKTPDALARDKAPCLVIANLQHPRGAGALIASLRSTYTAPILAVSARFRRGLGASRSAARQLGVRKVLPIPFTRAELLAAVRESIEGPA